CLIVMVALQFRPRCTRAHTVNRRPASVSAAPNQNSQAPGGRKRTPSAGTGEFGIHRRRPANASGTMCNKRDACDSRLAVTLALSEAVSQYVAQLNHRVGIR